MVELSISANFKFSIITTQASNHSITTRKTQEPPKNPNKTFPPKKPTNQQKNKKSKLVLKSTLFVFWFLNPMRPHGGGSLKQGNDTSTVTYRSTDILQSREE